MSAPRDCADCRDLCPACGCDFTASEAIESRCGHLCCCSACAVTADNDALAARQDAICDRERDERLLRGEEA